MLYYMLHEAHGHLAKRHHLALHRCLGSSGRQSRVLLEIYLWCRHPDTWPPLSGVSQLTMIDWVVATSRNSGRPHQWSIPCRPLRFHLS